MGEDEGVLASRMEVFSCVCNLGGTIVDPGKWLITVLSKAIHQLIWRGGGWCLFFSRVVIDTAFVFSCIISN